jgi:adenine-specific DNA-methyltransferase
MTEYITSSNAPYGIHRPRKRYYFEQTKIIMPSMFANNNFAIDYGDNIYVGMSFSCIVVTSKEYLIEYILAVLNSTIAYNWFYSTGKKRGAGVDIGVDKIRTFPIKPCSIERQSEIAKMVKLLHEDYDTNKELDKKLDNIVSKIYEEE